MSSIAKRPNGKWRARYRDAEGREHARHFERKADAERWVADGRGQVVRGLWIDPALGRTTIRAYAEQWRVAQLVRPTTARLREGTLRRHIYPELGERHLAALRRSDIQSWVTALSQRRGPAIVHQAYSLLRTVFRAAVDDRYLAQSPCIRIQLPRIPQQHVILPTIEEVQRIADLAHPTVRPMVLLAATTGLRAGEVLGLQVDSIDFLRRTVTVRQQLIELAPDPPRLAEPKTESSKRVVPAPQFTLDSVAVHLANAPAIGGLLFRADNGGPYRRSTMYSRWLRALRAAGVEHRLHFHHLRHFYASLLIDGGESVKVVQERLGHSSPVETLRTYTHLWPSSVDRTRTLIESAWGGEASNLALP